MALVITMNHNLLLIICAYFELGTPIESATKVHGGLLNLMWQVNTHQATYAIKQIASDTDLSDANIESYNLSEKIAADFSKHGIPAVSAIEHQGAYLKIIDGTGFLVYPWIDAKTIGVDEISEKHALQIAVILAKMHNINLNVPEILEPKFDTYTKEDLLELINKAKNSDCVFANLLKQHQAALLTANYNYLAAIPLLKRHAVVSHADLDQKNVLWKTDGAPILIDWESARKLNPSYEIINASLCWSGITTVLNKELFIKMITAYRDANGVIQSSEIEAAFYGVLGNWINWLAYNINRACDTQDLATRNMSIIQVTKVLPVIIRLQIMIPDLLQAI